MKSVTPCMMPDGRLTYSLFPHRDSALPILPCTRGPVALHDAALPPAPSPWSPLVTGSVIEPSEPTGTSASNVRDGSAAAPVIPLHRSWKIVACTVCPKMAGSMSLTVTPSGPAGPPPMMMRACRFAGSSVARPCSVSSVLPSGGVTATVCPDSEEYQLYSHHWAFGIFCWATESPSDPLMFQYARSPSTFSASSADSQATIWPGLVSWYRAAYSSMLMGSGRVRPTVVSRAR